MPISGNYYDDLLARLDLDAGAGRADARGSASSTTATAAGEYFHIYSESFDDRFFFEIVQRIDATTHYGALNAPARMASQEQASQRG